MSNSRSSGQYFGIKAGEGSLSELYIGEKGGTQATFVTASSVDGKADVHNINNLSASSLTASHVRINTLDVVTINSIQTTQEDLNISASLIVASDGASASDEADGSGLFISGANASFTWNNTKSAMVVNQAFSGSSTIQGGGITGTSLALQSGGITAAGSIAGATSITSTGLVSGSGGLVSQGATTLGSTLNVSGAVTFGDALTATSIAATSYSGSSTMHNVGAATFGGTVASTGSITAGTSFIIGSANIDETDLEKIDGITNGAGAANKALVLDGNADVASGLRSVTGSGDAKFANLHATAGVFAAGAMSAGGNLTGGGDLTIAGAVDGVTSLTMSGLLSSSAGMMVRGDAAFAGNIALSGALTASALQMNTDGSSIGYNGGNVELDVAGGTVMTLTSTNMEVGVKISGSGGAHIDGAATFGGNMSLSGAFSGSSTMHNVGAATFGGNVAATGSITAGSSFIIGSADISETDLEKIDGITDGTVAANKAVVVDSSKDADGFRNIDGTGDLTMGTITMAGFAVDADGDTALKSLTVDDGSTIGTDTTSDALTLAANGDTTLKSGLDFNIAGHNASDTGLKLGGTLVTASAGELNLLAGGSTVGSSITIADSDGFVVNDGGTMKTIPASDIKTYAAGALSSSNRIYSATGVETSGYLKVSGSATFDGAAAFNAGATTTTLSASSTLHAVGAATFGGTVASTGSITAGNGLTVNSAVAAFNAGATTTTLSASSTLQAVGAATLGSTLNVTGTLTHAAAILPSANGTLDLGSTTNRYANVYANNLVTGDLHMKNERGDWTLFEESDHIRIRNNATGQVFEMNMTLIEE